MSQPGERVVHRTCPLCEAGCGLEITVRSDGTVGRIRGDLDDVFSKGYLCPKGSTLRQLHDDPDRLRTPMVKRDGVHVPVSWEEAWHEVDRLLAPVIAAHGQEALGIYLGNPTAHNLSAMLYTRALIMGLGTRYRFSASTVDQAPKQVASGYLFGTPVTVAVPDLDRTDYLLMLGANPYASNGSLCTAPDFPGRLEALQARGGRLVVVDPRRSRTAEQADEWIAIRPATDAHLLMAILVVLFRDGLADPGDAVRPHLAGWDELAGHVARFDLDSLASVCGIDAAVIERIAHELAAAPTAAVYGRIGTCTQRFGTTASWLVDLVNIATGNLDRAGGAMFPRPAAGSANTHGAPARGKGFQIGRGHSPVRGLPEVMGEYPVVAMAEEITSDRPGRLRALVTVAGNPVLSCPDSGAIDRALTSLEAMVSVDIYLNETTRHADVVLPPPSQLERSHYDVLLLQFAVRNVAHYSPPVLPRPDGQPDEWEIMAKLALIAQGAGPDADPNLIDEQSAVGLLRSAVRDHSSNVAGREPDELMALLGGRTGPERLLDIMLRTGPYGDGFGAEPDGLTLAALEAAPHGVDLGALEPRIPEILRTLSGKVELCPAPLVADLDRLAAERPSDEMVLVGRRHVRSNNSWMHNIAVLTKGTPRCTLQVHPDDATRLGLINGADARIRSGVGEVVAPVELTDGIRPGVVSLPHGWGHGQPGSVMANAAANAGVNSNLLADSDSIDPLSGNAVLNGIPVELSPV